jgi:Sugar (and other) transporter
VIISVCLNDNLAVLLVFAALNALIIPIVYFFFPETAGRSLEDMDIIFAIAYNEGVSPVGVSFRKDLPTAGTPEADAILGHERKHGARHIEDKGSREA